MAGHWLILAGENSVGAAQRDSCSTAGLQLPSSHQPGSTSVIRRHTPTLVRKPAEIGALRGVIHLWGSAGGDAVQQTLQLGYGSALFLTQALLRQSAADAATMVRDSGRAGYAR